MGCKPQTAEDFAQDCALLWISGKRNIRTNYKWLFVDYMRKNGNGQGTRRHKDAMLGAIQCGNILSFESHVNKSRPQRINTDSLPMLGTLKRIERICVVLHYSWGFTFDEIGFCLGVKGPRVSQIITIALSEIKRINQGG